MTRTGWWKGALAPLGLLALSIGAPTVSAQAPEAAPVAEIEELVVIGSRRQDRSATDLPVPVDVIGGSDFENMGSTDMDDMLANLIPSYNVDQVPIGDAATLVRPANLRGLSSDATLILVNGKRRHRSAVITFLGGGHSDGAQGPDLSVIPAVAIDRVEVLRDGASAQYGSDAIAGVINFALKEDADGGKVEARWGQYYEGDGDAFNVAANIGLPLTDAGFANFSLEFKESDPTSRSVQRADAQGLIDAGNTAVRQPAAQIWGAPEFRDDFKFFGNVGLDLGNGSQVYAFGNWAERTVEGGFFYRNPHTRGGIFDGPGDTILVADLTGDLSGNCPVVNIANNVADPAALAAVAADPNCFAFNERFPGGFTPQFGGELSDSSIAVGVRGELRNGWNYDLSAVAGRSNVQFFINNTINPQLASRGTSIPTEYNPGAYTETDRVFNLDLSREIGFAGLAAPLHLAVGVEYREETFKIENGGENSFFVDPNLANQGFGIGSNGFPGFSPRIAGEDTRGSYSGWVDIEADLSDSLLLNFALRYEDYEDFGSTLDGKVAARLEVSPTFALRGAVSTGFRAPTVGQSSVRNVSTVFDSGRLADRATLPPTDPIAVQKGGEPLEPEESINFTIGAAFALGDMDVTLDYYHITIEDRIAQGSPQTLTPTDIQALLLNGIADATSYQSVTFFTNDFDTTTQGIDLVGTYAFGGTTLTGLANWTGTSVDKRNPDIISDTRVRQIEDARPEFRFSVTANHVWGDWRFLSRVRYYAKFFEAHLNVASLALTGKPRWFVDAEAAYSFTDSLSVVAGAQNLFDQYPSKNPFATIVGAKYPESSPYGFNGGYYYFRAIWEFN